MKKIFFLLTFILITQFTIAQEKQGIVNYGYIKSLLTGQKQGEEYKAQLLFDSKRSYFVTQKDSLENNVDKTEEVTIIEPNEANGNVGVINLSGSNSRLITNYVGNQVYFEREKDTLWSYVMGMGNMYIKEKKPTISWKFEKETKKIGKYTCHKATAPFRGRDYTVWYTTEIPIPYGPWKLNGLPGLVLEAYDSEYKIYFYFKNMEYPVKETIKISFVQEDIEEKRTKWFRYSTYLKHAKDLIETKRERMLLVLKDHPGVTVRVVLEEQYIEIAE
ncbi:GLPGLI family protein [Flavobacterium sp. TP390]|uniref:GLPGLI family protein n=1 Tax=Flavobacterium profundi TaxID=1774945 RepID=A0A6I4IH02_9FLAO|nr:GLPGLI family protein [Flavobacterium profundi]MVO08890.1 GLPGLI family protein [Flavobacterium profundi]